MAGWQFIFGAVSINMSTPVEIGIPIPASFSTAGTAKLELIKAETFEWTGEDAVFTANLSLDAFKNSFLLTEVEDACGDLSVSMDPSGEEAFLVALRTALVAAKYASGAEPNGYNHDDMVAGTSTLQAYLESWAQAELDADLSDNGIDANLEAEHVFDLALTDFADDASSGAANMWTALSNASQKFRDIIARQLPHSRYASNPDQEYANRLPVVANDVITFRFNIDQVYEVTNVSAATTGVSGPAAVYTPPAYPFSAVSGSGNATVGAMPTAISAMPYDVGTRKINLVLTLVA